MITQSKCWCCGKEDYEIMYYYNSSHYSARCDPGTNVMLACKYCPKHPNPPLWDWGDEGNGPCWSAYDSDFED
jgi:hypothetical protein